MDYRDIANRAIWTAVQAFAGVALVGGKVNLTAGAIAALAAVISLVKTVAAQQLKKYRI